MRSTLLVIALFLTGTFSLSAQTKTGTAPSKTGTAAKPKAAAPKDTSLCSKNWILVGTEEFGVESKPTKKQTGDYLRMTGNGKYSLRRNGEDKSGTWTRSGAYIFFVDEASKEKFNYKVENTEDRKLKVDYHVSDMHTIFNFELN
ncbi:MAG TPA: hypothetical protein VGO45_06360 [Bacteroidia bacterium]|jgi:hypothetical protein|nr:hypothetical protein [Bacteroidia bacterium]